MTTEATGAAITLGTITLSMVFNKLNVGEKCLNILGYIPFVGTFSSYGRGCLAGAELTAGVALLIFANFAIAAPFLLHGVLNGIRVVFERVPGVSLVTCLPYDLFFGRCFPYPV
jgi:hypothetical protein